MKKLAALGVFALCLSATACSGTAATAPVTVTQTVTAAPSVESTPSSASASASPQLTDRGNIVKAWGKVATLASEDGTELLNFKLVKVDRSPRCQDWGNDLKPKGKLIAVKVEAETTKAVASEDPATISMLTGWQFIGTNGTTTAWDPCITDAVFNCNDIPDQITQDIGPASKVTGWLVLDVPASKGTLVWQPGGPGTRGWEWTL